MPPKPNEDKSSSEASKKKSKSQTSYADQKLDEISVTRARIIASKLGISNPGKHIKVALIPLIRENLALVTDCAAVVLAHRTIISSRLPILALLGAPPAAEMSLARQDQTTARAGNISSL